MGFRAAGFGSDDECQRQDIQTSVREHPVHQDMLQVYKDSTHVHLPLCRLAFVLSDKVVSHLRQSPVSIYQLQAINSHAPIEGLMGTRGCEKVSQGEVQPV